MKPTRAQLEIGLLVAGTLAILILYRNYLQRALALQEQQLRDVSGPPASASSNGRAGWGTPSAPDVRSGEWHGKAPDA